MCPACGNTTFQAIVQGTDRLYGTTNKRFQVVECQECRLMHLHPMPKGQELASYYPPSYWFDGKSDQADTLAERYRRLVLLDHVFFVERAAEAAEKELDERAGRPGKRRPILDIGCGGGLFLRLMRERGYRVVGLDYSREAAGVAWHTNRVPALGGDVTRPPFAPESFSLITMFHVLEHVSDPVRYVEAVRDLLVPGGRFVLQVPNAASWQFLFFGDRWNGVDIPRHLIHFRHEDLAELLRFCGFELVRTKYFSLRDNPAGLATTLALGLDPMSRRIRRPNEAPGLRMAKDLAYFALMLACLPPAVIEAASGAGATMMLEARKK